MTITEDATILILRRLSEYLSNYKVVSDDELLIKIDDAISSLTDDERSDLRESLGDDSKLVIFRSIVSGEKISMLSPDLSEKYNLFGHRFHYPYGYKLREEDLKSGLIRRAKLCGIMDDMEETVRNFMKDCGYETSLIRENDTKEMFADKDGESLHIYILASIMVVPDFMSGMNISKPTVIIVPVEHSPSPFMDFIREHQYIEDEANLMIWVANYMDETIDPLVGIPSDKEIRRNFRDPEKAMRAKIMWKRGSVKFEPDF